MSRGDELLAIAAREIGYREGKNSANKFGAWFGLDYVPWCMIFVQWVYAQAGIPLPYRTGSCGLLLDWYKAHDPACVTTFPVPGCIVIFDFPGTKYRTDHTGLFVKKTVETVTTIDGNTSGGNDANGGWVQQRTRPLSYANPVYIIPRELVKAEEDGMDIDKLIEGLTPEQARKLAAKLPKEERYNSLEEIAAKVDWATPTVQRLLDRDILEGTGTGLDLSRDMLRLLVLMDRAGAFGGR